MPDGMFGPIKVVDRNGRRSLLLNGQVQGSAYLQPSASILQGDLTGPGPIMASKYMLGWLMAACDCTGSGLMIGLGSGAGVIGLLANNPDIDLTVVEIDPIMIQQAEAGFPLLGFYQDMGRLRIVNADAGQYLAENDVDIYTFGCADAYTGENKLEAHYLPDFINSCENLYFNVISELDGPGLEEVKSLLDVNGRPVTEVLPIGAPGQDMYNIIVTSTDVDQYKRNMFVPYAEIEDYRATEWQELWRQLLVADDV